MYSGLYPYCRWRRATTPAPHLSRLYEGRLTPPFSLSPPERPFRKSECPLRTLLLCAPELPSCTEPLPLRTPTPPLCTSELLLWPPPDTPRPLLRVPGTMICLNKCLSKPPAYALYRGKYFCVDFVCSLSASSDGKSWMGFFEFGRSTRSTRLTCVVLTSWWWCVSGSVNGMEADNVPFDTHWA